MKFLWADAERPGGVEIDGWVFRVGDRTRRPDVARVGPVHVKGRATASRNVCAVDCRVQAETVYRCSRCLTSVEDLLDAPLQEVFSRLPLTLVQEEADVVYAPDEAIELNSYAEQAVFLGMRLQALCTSQCRGLCAVCGSDRNTSSCNCETEYVDPRWEALGDAVARGKE